MDDNGAVAEERADTGGGGDVEVEEAISQIVSEKPR